jgi:uncharacterized zinc-type alcohol dehydrogenase-like protein
MEYTMSEGNSYEARAFAAKSATSPLAPATIRRREPGPRDVQLQVLHCGVCHSDLHQVRNEWESFMLRVANGSDLAGTAPLLCAGITTYSPLRHWNVRAGQKVGVVGLGGLGHMAVKFAHAFDARVVVFTTSPGKADDAVRLGADEVVVSTDAAAMEKQAGSFDFILDTVSAPHDINAYVALLKRNGTMTLVGAPEAPTPLVGFGLIFGRRSVAGSLIGGIRQTQEMLDFCAERGITADVERISMQQINEAYGRMLKGDVKYRFVIDMETLK